MLELLARLNVSAPVLLSGDVHLAEFALGSCRGGRLLEVTSSGMTHSWGTRDASFSNNQFLSWAMYSFISLAQAVMPFRYQMRDPAQGASMYFLGLNFGELEFDWHQRSVAVRVFGDGGGSEPQLQQLFQFSDLGVGGAGAAGVQDFAPERGNPEAWRVCLGMATVAAVPLTVFAGFLTVFCLGIRRCRRALRKPGEDSASDESSESEVDSDSAPLALSRS